MLHDYLKTSHLSEAFRLTQKDQRAARDIQRVGIQSRIRSRIQSRIQSRIRSQNPPKAVQKQVLDLGLYLEEILFRVVTKNMIALQEMQPESGKSSLRPFTIIQCKLNASKMCALTAQKCPYFLHAALNHS